MAKTSISKFKFVKTKGIINLKSFFKEYIKRGWEIRPTKYENLVLLFKSKIV